MKHWRWILTLLFGVLVMLASAQTFQRSLPFLAKTSATAAFSPTNITGMVLWVDPYSRLTNISGSTPPGDGDRIQSWGNKVDGAAVLAVTNVVDGGSPPYYNPVYATSGGPTNGPKLSFSYGGGDATLMLKWNAGTWSQTNTIFVVGYVSLLVWEYFDTQTSTRQACSVDNANRYLSMYAGTALTGPANTITANAGWYILTFQFAGANSILRTNGVLHVSGNAGSQACNGITIGNYSGGSYNAKDMAEVIFYNNGLSPSQMLQVEEYLGAKYSITVP